jgi:hypothetical protein
MRERKRGGGRACGQAESESLDVTLLKPAGCRVCVCARAKAKASKRASERDRARQSRG